MKTFTLLVSHPTEGLITKTVTAETLVAAVATLDFGCVVITISKTDA